MHKAFLCRDEEAGNVNSYGCITHYLLGSECAILRKVYQASKANDFSCLVIKCVIIEYYKFVTNVYFYINTGVWLYSYFSYCNQHMDFL